MPGLRDPWGLVVNEGMASGLPVLVSRGCGAAGTLVHEGENGWTFEAGDSAALTGCMVRLSCMSATERGVMGRRSKEIISEWPLRRFSAGVMEAVKIPRRAPAGFISCLATRYWRGRVSIN